MHEHLPAVVSEVTEQQHFHTRARFILYSVQARRNDLGIVDNKNIIRLEHIYDIVKDTVPYLAGPAIDRHKSGHIAALGGSLRYKLLRQIVVKIALFQVGSDLFVYNNLFFRHRFSVSP